MVGVRETGCGFSFDALRAKTFPRRIRLGDIHANNLNSHHTWPSLHLTAHVTCHYSCDLLVQVSEFES